MEQLYLNTNPNGIKPVCHASQYDNNRTIRFHLLDNTEPITLIGTEVIQLFIRKADNSRATFEIANSGGTYVDLVVTTEMSDIAGDSECKFQIANGEITLGSLAFKMKIESDAYGDSLKTRSVSGPIASFKTDLAEDLIKLDVDLEPIQDLHGYDGAWPAGGEKNKLPPNGTDSSTTINGITFTASNGVYTIKGTSTEAASISYPLKASVDMSPSTQKIVFLNTEGNTGVSLHFRRNGGNIHYWQMHPANRVASNWTDTGNELIDEIMISVAANKTVNMTISPMFLLLSETSETPFAPYSNICSISGHDSAQLFRTGKNWFDISDCNGSSAGLTWETNGNTITWGGTATTGGWKSIKTFTLPVGTYHFHLEGDGYWLERFASKGKDVTITVTDETTVYRLAIVAATAGQTYSGTITNIQIESGSAATPYEPYESDQTPITVYFGQTVYKGKLYSEQRKVLVTHVCETYDGSEDENWISTTTTSVRYGFRTYFQHNKKPTAQSIDEMLSSVIPLKKSSESSSVDDNIITCHSTTYLYNIFYIFAPPSKISTVEELRAFLANEPETVMYPLNEPFYIDLSQEQTEDVERAAIASFETNIQRSLETSEHYFSCSQAEGTPTPDSPIPITGVSEITAYRTGKNLLPTQTLEKIGYQLYVGNNQYSIFLKAGTYTLRNSGRAKYTYIREKNDTSNTVIHTASTNVGTFTLPKDGFYNIWFYDSTATVEDFYDIQLELGSTATPYEPYSGESITVSLGGTYYGGKFVQSEDGSRKLVLTHGLFSKAIANMDNTDAYPGWKNSGIKDMVGAGIDGSETGILNIGTNYAFNTKGTNDILYLPRGSYNSLTQTQWMANYPDLVVQIVVPLAEPIEINLPDGDPLTTIAGENNVYCNTGDTALTYYYNMVADPIRIPALVGTNNVYSDAGDVDVEYYTTLEGGND